MFLSVSMPVYNAEKYLDECIQSVIDQSEQDYELILVDDGSKDGSAEICEAWVKKYPDKIRFIRKENSGSLFTRRVCLQKSKGDYLYVMDSDDYLIDNDAFKTFREVIEKQKCDLLFFDCTSNLDTMEKEFKFPFADGTVFQGESIKEIRKYYLSDRGLNPLWNKVFHRSLVDWDFDYTPYSFVTNGTDRLQSTPIVSRATKACYLDRVFYFYRQINNSGSIIHKFKSTLFASSKANFVRAFEEAEKWGLGEDYLEEVRRRQFMKLASTQAYKVRLIKNGEASKVDFLKAIGEDPLFQKYYSLSCPISLSRKALVFMLHKKLYGLMALLIR